MTEILERKNGRERLVTQLEKRSGDTGRFSRILQVVRGYNLLYAKHYGAAL